MFHQFLPSPTVYTAPTLDNTVTYEIELVHALDVSNYKTGALVLRIHASTSPMELRLKAYKIWPFADAVGVRFQDKSGTPVTETDAAEITDVGTLVTTSSPATLCAPALRIVLEIKAAGATVDAGMSCTISAGIVLLTD